MRYSNRYLNFCYEILSKISIKPIKISNNGIIKFYPSSVKSLEESNVKNLIRCFSLDESKSNIEITGLLEEEAVVESVNVHSELNPKLWNSDNTLKQSVENQIKKIVKKFAEYVHEQNIELLIRDIYIVGSNANYTYSKKSDLDIHIIADESFDCKDKHLPLIYDAYKTIFNSRHDIQIKGIDVELYVENIAQLSGVSAGIYSLKHGWINDPQLYKIPEVDETKIAKEVSKWEKRYLKLIKHPTSKAIDSYLDDIYKLRQDLSLEAGEFSTGNLIFKEIRNLEYLDNLKQLKIELEDRELSLENYQEQ